MWFCDMLKLIEDLFGHGLWTRLERSLLFGQKKFLTKGFESNEIVSRPLISSKYYEALWVQLLYVTRVWTIDESEDFQVTDAAIEKSSALLFELMKSGPVDLLIDFCKFAYQNKAY